MSSKTGLFDKLDQEWPVFAASAEGRAGLLRWAVAEPDLTGFVTLDELLEALRGRTAPDRRDQRMLALLRLARQDPAARRLALQVVRPALSGHCPLVLRAVGSPRRVEHGHRRGPGTHRHLPYRPPPDQPRRPHRARHQAHPVPETGPGAGVRERLRHARALVETEDRLVAPPDRTAADRVTAIVTDAVRAGKITRRHARLVLDSRIGGVPIQEIAAAWHRPPQTVRRMRQRVERVLADVAVA